MGLFDFFKKGGNDNDEVITELTDKVAELEATVEKSALSDSLDYVSDGNYYSYELNTDKSYKNNYTVYRGVNLLADMIAQLPLKLYRGEQELPADFVFPNGFSLAKPNPSMSLNELLYKSCVYYFFRGEFLNHIIDDGIFRLEPINPKNIHRNPDDTWRLNQKNKIIIIQKEELIYNPLFNPTITNYNTVMDRGLSPIDVVKAEITSDAAAGEYITKFFENFAQLGGTLFDSTGNATPEQINSVVAQFNSNHQSKGKAYKVLGLPDGIEYKEMSQTMREMQFLDSRKDIRDKILAVLGIHKSLLGETDAVNRSVAEEATRQLWVQTLKPKAIRIQEKYNQQLFNVYFPGYFCKFDFSEVKELQDNKESIIKQAEAYRKLGYSLNEVNEHFKLGMEEITDPEGNQRYVPRILTTLELMTTPPIAQTPPKEPVTPPKKAIDKAADLLSEIGFCEDGQYPKKNKDYRDTYLRKRKPLEKKFHSKIKRHFNEQRGNVLSIVNNAKHIHNITNDLNKLFNDEDPKLQKTTEPLYKEGVEVGIDLVASQLKGATGMVNKVPVEPIGIVDEAIILARTNKIVGINHTVYNQIKMSMWENLRDGGTIQEFSKEIKNIYNFAGTRSTTIARTETGGIMNESTMGEYRKKGVEKKRWVGGTPDKRNHAATNGTVIPLDEAFQMADGSSLMFPGDPNGGVGAVVNCRCAIAAVIGED